MSFDKSAVKCFFAHQRQVAGPTFDKLQSQIVVVIRMEQFQVTEKKMDLCQQDPEHARNGLPEKKFVAESDLGKREVQLTIALIVKQKFKIVREVGHIHDNGLFSQLSNSVCLRFIYFDPGVEKFEEQGGYGTDFGRKKTAVVIVSPFEDPGQPLPEF